jgi:single-stranded-DNA-specific exonuclease
MSDFKHKYFKDAVEIIKSSKRILVWGDEDSDGITSTAIMMRTLKAVGKRADYFIPSRKRDGIGITNNGIKRINEKEFDTVMTVDCGSVNYAEIKKIIKKNKRVIITDHHVPHDRLIAGVPYINPHLLKNDKFSNLSGAGVAFILSQLLLVTFKVCSDFEEAWEYDNKNLSLAALGTKCDRVKEDSINSALLKSIKHFKRDFTVFGDVKVKEQDLCSVVATSKTAERRNMMVEIFTENNKINADRKITHISNCLSQVNEYRKNIQTHYSKLKRALKLNGEEKRILLVEEDIEYKYIGVLAGILTEETGIPVCIIGKRDAEFTGECRAKNVYNWVEFLKTLKAYFVSWGGHPQAAGFTLKGEKIELFINAFNTSID